MGEVLSPEICVIGGGIGGVTAAVTVARHGVPVVLVENGVIGGSYLQAEIARRALGAISCRAADFTEAKTFGLNVARPKIDFYRVHDRIREVIDGAAVNFSAERLNGLGVQMVREAARFADQTTLLAGDTQIKARHFIVAGNAMSVAPPISGLEDVPYLTTETIVDLLVCPKELVVLGATPEGFELAQAYRRLGADVTVIDSGEALAGYDPECAGVVLNQLKREDIEFRIGIPITQIKRVRSRTQIFLGASKEEKIEATHLLLATNRKPHFAELDLPAANVWQDAEGIIVDRYFRTANKRVYAFSAGAHSSPHAARKQAEAVVRHALFRAPFIWSEHELPRVVFTKPALAQVGMTEAQLGKRTRSFRVLRSPHSENDRAQAEGKTAGHVKIIVSRKGQILGAAVVGAQADELITSLALAIAAKMDIGALANLPATSPSFAEISRQAAQSYAAPGLAPRRIRRIMAALRPRR